MDLVLWGKLGQSVYTSAYVKKGGKWNSKNALKTGLSSKQFPTDGLLSITLTARQFRPPSKPEFSSPLCSLRAQQPTQGG